MLQIKKMQSVAWWIHADNKPRAICYLEHLKTQQANAG